MQLADFAPYSAPSNPPSSSGLHIQKLCCCQCVEKHLVFIYFQKEFFFWITFQDQIWGDILTV